MPSPAREHAVDFPRLDGGLNTWDLSYRLGANESPEMKNLWWKNGALCSRDGQIYLWDRPLGEGRSAYESLYCDHAFFHIGDRLYSAYIPETDPVEMRKNGAELKAVRSGVGTAAGTWFRYGDPLYYKNKGGYYRIAVSGERVSCENVAAYTPVIRINADPTTGEGEAYQDENRLSGQKTVWYSTAAGVTAYRLPERDIRSVDRVVVDGVTLTGGFSVDNVSGTITFESEPAHYEQPVPNTVRITYTKDNARLYSSIMDCGCAAVYGADQDVCIVLSGSAAQPNAYFWCGRHSEMDPGYFPVGQYNLAGDKQDKITGFGRQQNMLVIFKERSVGRSSMGARVKRSGWERLTMNYAAINAAIGCDLPGSIQLVENNLVFASTRNGVCIVRDSSSAYENNILPISRKVDNGLMTLLQKAVSVCSHDDGERYWIAADGEVYCWDYALSRYDDPVWFYFANIPAHVFLSAARTTMHLDSEGRLSVMCRDFQDYGAAIEKKYRFAAQYMGGYEKLKDVTGVIFAVRGDTNTFLEVDYITDHESRRDLTGVRATSWRLNPRNLAFRDLGINPFATVARRKPMCRHVRHFTMELSNNEIGMDMAVISAQVFYRYQGRDR